MDTKFITIIQKLASEQGRETLFNPIKCRAFLADYTHGEYKKESRLLMQALEAGVPKAIDATDDLEICKKQQVMLLHEEYSLVEDIAKDIVNIFILILKGNNEIANNYCKNCKKEINIEWKICPFCGIVINKKMTATGLPPELKNDVNTYEEIISDGRKYYEKVDFINAIEKFSEAIRLCPNYASGYIWRAEVYLTQYQIDQAMKDCNKAIKIDPNSSPAYTMRGNTYLRQGQSDMAMKDIIEAIRLNPNNSDAYLGRAVAYLLQSQTHMALEDCNMAIRLNPSNSDAYAARAMILLTQQEIEIAINDSNKAVKLNPNNSDAYAARAMAYTLQGEIDMAIKNYNKAIKLNPYNSDAYTSRGDAYILHDQIDMAIKDYKKAIKLNPNNSNAYVGRGAAYSLQEQTDMAIKDFNKAIKLNPSNSDFYTARGNAYLLQSLTDMAIKDFEKALSINPNNEVAAKHLRNAKEKVILNSNPPIEQMNTNPTSAILKDVRIACNYEGVLIQVVCNWLGAELYVNGSFMGSFSSNDSIIGKRMIIQVLKYPFRSGVKAIQLFCKGDWVNFLFGAFGSWKLMLCIDGNYIAGDMI